MTAKLIKLSLVMLLVPIAFTCLFVGHVKADTATPLAVSCTSTPASQLTSPLGLGTKVTFSATATGGTGAYTYTWTGACLGNGSSCSNSWSSNGNYTANISVYDGTTSQSSTCGTYIAQACTTHASKACGFGADVNKVFWFDSCGIQQDVFQTCSATQTCCAGACIDSCTPNASQKCVGNSVYNFDSCGTQGTLVTACTSTQTCTNSGSTASCVNQNIACSTNSQCGTNGLIGNPFCKSGNVYQSYQTWTCNNPGTSTSSCTAALSDQLVTTCTANQSCNNGTCTNNTSSLSVSCTGTPNPVNVNQSAVFIATPTGGSGTYTYAWAGACTGSNQTCTSPVFTQSGTQTATVVVTSSGSSTPATTTCNVTVNQGQTCTTNFQQRCVGNALYWYDSCGVQGSLYQTCPNGCTNNSCSNNNPVTVQTNQATNVTNNQATLNGYLYTGNYNNNNSYSTCNSSVWFQYGTSMSYGSQTSQQSQSYSGAFSQPAYNLYSGNTYHFRAVAQDCSGNLVYGQDMIISSNNNGNGSLNVSKTVRNLTNGSGFATSTSANPGDVLMFMITLQSNGQDVQNVFVRDNLPANLIYNNQLVVACTGSSNSGNCNGSNYNYGGSISSGINLNTVYAGQTVTITYQVQVASAGNFTFGTTTLNNSVTTTSSNTNYTPTASASVIVNRVGVLGASSVSTGLTNNFWLDSFFLPLMITLFGLWMWKSGMFFGIEKWLDDKKKVRKGFKAEKELEKRIESIQKIERA